MATLILSNLLSLFLPWRSLPETGSTSLSPEEAARQAAVESPESVLLQQDDGADLESGHLEAPSLRNQDSEKAAEGGLQPRPQRQQLSTTASRRAFGVTEGQASSVRQRDRVSILRAGESGQVPAAKLKEYLKYSFLVISVSTGTLINLFFVRRTEEPLSKNPSLIVASASAFTSLISAFGLTFGTMRQMMMESSARRDSSCSWLKPLFCMSTVSLTFTVLSITVSFLPKAYYYLPLVLVPTLLVIFISLYGDRRRDCDIILGGNDPHKDDRERSLQLTMNMTAFSLAGAIGTVTGYYKVNSSNQAMHVYVKVSIYFMLSAAITCLLILLLSRLRGRKDWKKIAVGNAIVLALLVIAVLIVAATFLGVVLAATPFPVAIAAAIWYIVKCNVPPDRDLDAAFSHEEEGKLMYTGAMTAMSMSFGAVMTTFAGFLGGQDKSGRLEIFVGFVVSCFISSVSLGVITFRAPKKASVAAAAIALACFTMVLLVLAALAMVSYVG